MSCNDLFFAEPESGTPSVRPCLTESHFPTEVPSGLSLGSIGFRFPTQVWRAGFHPRAQDRGCLQTGRARLRGHFGFVQF